MLRMHLVVFDVDGTLTDTNALDAECFWQAVREILQLPSGHSQWLEKVEHYTDLGIAAQHCKAAFGRDITESEVDLLKVRRVELLEAAVLANSECIRAIHGAADALAAVQSLPNCAAAIATGCFRASAEFKLRKAGLFDASVPIAGCDRALSREEIMTGAAGKAASKHGREFSSVTYVGDGVWDVEAAKHLGWGFIGIGSGDGAERLRRAGATMVLNSFQAPTPLLDALSKATLLGK